MYLKKWVFCAFVKSIWDKNSNSFYSMVLSLSYHSVLCCMFTMTQLTTTNIVVSFLTIDLIFSTRYKVDWWISSERSHCTFYYWSNLIHVTSNCFIACEYSGHSHLLQFIRHASNWQVALIQFRLTFSHINWSLDRLGWFGRGRGWSVHYCSKVIREGRVCLKNPFIISQLLPYTWMDNGLFFVMIQYMRSTALAT